MLKHKTHTALDISTTAGVQLWTKFHEDYWAILEPSPARAVWIGTKIEKNAEYMREFDLPMRDVNYGKLSGDLIYQWGMVNYGKQSHPTCPRPLAHIWTWTNSFYFHNLEKKFGRRRNGIWLHFFPLKAFKIEKSFSLSVGQADNWNLPWSWKV